MEKYSESNHVSPITPSQAPVGKGASPGMFGSVSGMFSGMLSALPQPGWQGLSQILPGRVTQYFGSPKEHSVDININSNSPLVSLPPELIVGVASHLDNQALASFSESCRALHAIASDDIAVWKPRVEADYGPEVRMEGSWKETYIGQSNKQQREEDQLSLVQKLGRRCKLATAIFVEMHPLNTRQITNLCERMEKQLLEIDRKYKAEPDNFRKQRDLQDVHRVLFGSVLGDKEAEAIAAKYPRLQKEFKKCSTAESGEKSSFQEDLRKRGSSSTFGETHQMSIDLIRSGQRELWGQAKFTSDWNTHAAQRSGGEKG